MDWLWMSMGLTPDWAGLGPMLLQIIIINIILSGDNAVVIALACRSLPPKQRKWGILLGALVAVVMRIVFTIGVTSLMNMPWLKVGGSLLLFWIAIKLLVEQGDGTEVAESTSIWGAVRTVAIADLVMSLDNVLAIAAAAKGNWALIIFGLVISVPLIVFGATLVMWLLTKFPILVWAGAALLGWIAGEMIIQDQGVLPFVKPLADWLGVTLHTLELVDAAIGAIFVVGMGWLLRRMHQKDEPRESHA